MKLKNVMKIDENPQQSMTIDEHQKQNYKNVWKSIKIYENLWKSMKINANRWKSPRDAHGGQNGSTGFEYWTIVGFVNLICFAMICYTLLC